MGKIIRFFKSFHFLKGLLISGSAFSALLLSYYFFELEMGIGMAFGVLVVAMSDITGLRRQRIGGMIIALFLGAFNYIMTQLSMNEPLLLYPVTAFCVFLSSYISIYGFRASLVSFASLLGIAVSFARPVSPELIDNFTGYFILGGIWYMTLALIIDVFTPPIRRNELVTNTLKQTAALLRKNILLINDPKNEVGKKEMNKLQTILTDLHEELRNELLIKETLQGIGGDQRKQLLVTAELIDLFELIVSQMPEQSYRHEGTSSFNTALNCVSKYLDQSVHQLLWLANDHHKAPAPAADTGQLQHQSLSAIEDLKEEAPFSKQTEELLFLQNLYDYAREVQNKIGCIERFMNRSIPGITEDEISEKEKFLTRQTYEPFLFKEHLSFKSPIFRHAIRMVVAILIGMLIGHYFSLPQTYWILLTIFVIMRPAYALTKQRSKQRTSGTIVGALISGILIYFFRDQTFLIITTFITLTLAFTYVQQNYKTSATFVTVAIIFIYVLLTSNAVEVIGYRIADTIIGALLALLTNYFILPFWEYKRLGEILQSFISAEIKYIDVIQKTYLSKNKTGTTYRLARKEVFLIISQLNAALQRLLQEPRSQQKGIKKLQELLSTAQSLLSASAALGTYIQIHQTTEASVHFDTYISFIRNNLKSALNLIEPGTAQPEPTEETIDEARDALVVHYYVLKDKLKRMESKGTAIPQSQFQEEVKEARLISGQLDWIYQLSLRLNNDLKDYLKAQS